MKIVFSRKGFDSQYGGVPSPIFPDGKMLSLPLPVDGVGSKTPICYADLSFGRVNVGKLVNDLTQRKENVIHPNDPVDLDPDLRRDLKARKRGWTPMFCLSSPSHLRNQGVFGTFQRVQHVEGRYCFKPEPAAHVIFGWIQIKFLIPAGKKFRRDAPGWAKDHPHFFNEWGGTEGGQLLIAHGSLSLPGLKTYFPAGGVFDHFSPKLQLSAKGCNKSLWYLPGAFGPEGGRSLLSYHSSEKWTRAGKGYLLQTAAKGQDFVFNADERPEALKEMANLFNSTITA